MRTNTWLAAAALGAALLFQPARAHAQFGFPQLVYDPSAVSKLVSQISSEVKQLAVAKTQLSEQVIALRKLPNPPWREITATMQTLDAVMRAQSSLAYAVPGVDGAFRETFPVTSAITNWPTAERVSAQRTVATLRATVDAASTQGTSFPAALDRIARMKSAMASVAGHEQALELNGSAAVFSAEELVLLRQALMAQATAQSVYYAHAVNDVAQRDESVRAQLAVATVPVPRRAPISLRLDP
jgi:P-type conjugative transfer protein TrbJ